MSIKYSNFVRKTLTATVATGDLTIEVSSATGLPAITASDWFRIVVTRMSDLAKEIMKVTYPAGIRHENIRPKEHCSLETQGVYLMSALFQQAR